MAAEPITINFTGLSGEERTMHVRHLGHREFFEIMHVGIGVLASAIKADGGNVKFNVADLIKALDFDTFSNVATKLLSGSVLVGHGQVNDPFDVKMFRDNPDELYLATYNALVKLHPDLFLKLEAEATKIMTGNASVRPEDQGAKE